MNEIKAVEIQAELRAIRTLSDGTFSVQLVLPEYMLKQIQIMMGWIKDEVRCVIEDETNP
jgi:hypothetical protein